MTLLRLLINEGTSKIFQMIKKKINKTIQTKSRINPIRNSEMNLQIDAYCSFPQGSNQSQNLPEAVFIYISMDTFA